MELFEANDKLVNVLQNQGFIETTDQENKIKGKRNFKLSKNARNDIYFDYINVRARFNRQEQSKITLSEVDLKLILLCFKLSSSDVKEFDKFNFKEIEEKLGSLKQELDSLIEFNLHKPRQNKIKRILETYKNIRLN